MPTDNALITVMPEAKRVGLRPLASSQVQGGANLRH